jgi:hypothetical protein
VVVTAGGIVGDHPDRPSTPPRSARSPCPIPSRRSSSSTPTARGTT